MLAMHAGTSSRVLLGLPTHAQKWPLPADSQKWPLPAPCRPCHRLDLSAP